MKKLIKLGYFFLLIVTLVATIYWRPILDKMRQLGEQEGGVLVGVSKLIGSYFTHWEAWNMIFLVIFISTSLVVFVLVDKGVQVVLRRAVGQRPSLQFIHSGWFTMTFQKGVSGLLTLLLFVIVCNAVVIFYGNSNSVREAVSIQEPQPVLILGTSKMLRSGRGENLYYTYRIDAARDLWEQGKVDYFIVSGDRSGDHYDETRDISNDLQAFGVPAEKIKLDTAGFRTLDSMVRIRGMYRVRDLIVISQQFHVQRALFLGMFYSINGTGYYAKGSSTFGMLVRETFGKCKLVLDIILFNMMPRVQLQDKAAMKHREDFQVKSDLHVILLIVVCISALSSIGLLFKALD